METRVPGESYGIARGPFGCGADGLHWVVEPEPGAGANYCPCGGVARVVSRDRYCIQRNDDGMGTCYCGSCPHYVPVPEVNYRAAVARMQQQKRDAEERARRERHRLASGQRKYQRSRRSS